MPNKVKLPEKVTGEERKSTIQKWLAGLKDVLSSTETELVDAGVERKELDEEGMTALVGELKEMLPDVADETIGEVIQAVADAVIIPEEADEEIVETAMEDEDEEEKSEEIKALTKEVTALATDWNGAYSDMREVMQVTIDVVKDMQKHLGETKELRAKVKVLESKVSSRPRRASKSDETKLDQDSDLAKNLNSKLYEPPEAFADIFKQDGGA